MNNALLNQKTENKNEGKSEQKKDQKKSVMLIGDSNSQRAKEHLDKTSIKWTLSNQIYTTDELKKNLSDVAMKQELQKHDIVIISQGTNDIWRGKKDEYGTYDSLLQSAQNINKLTGKTVMVNQLPPIDVEDRYDLTLKAASLNNMIAKINNKGIKPILSEQLLGEYPNDEILDKRDGVHLINDGPKTYAAALSAAVLGTQKLEKHTERKTDTDTDPEKIVEKTIITKPEVAGHIIGKEGTTVRGIEETNNVSITTRQNETDYKVTITGQSETSVQAAYDEILRIINKNSVEKEKPVCRFYLQKRCNFGDKCHYRHPAQTPKRGRSPDRSARGSPKRKVQKGEKKKR